MTDPSAPTWRLLFALLACPWPDLAASALPPEPLEKLNVTAHRIPARHKETLASFEVLDRADIEKSQARSVLELLRGLAGVDFSNQGGFGKPTSLYLRGANPGHVMVMIDGVRVGSATLGAFSWQYLPVSQIDRVELVRGPRSHLYGSEAVGGVVHIFTRRAAEGNGVDARLGAGSNDSYEFETGLSAGSESDQISLRVSHFETSGYDATEGNNPDRDGFENNSASGRFIHDFGGGNELSLSVFRSQGNNEYDGFAAADVYDADFMQQNLASRLNLQVTDTWRVELEIGESRDYETDHVNGQYASDFKTRRREVDWSNHFELDDGGDLSVGLERLNDRVDGSSDYAERERYNNALFARFGQAFGRGRLSAGLRFDDNESFGDETTGNVAWGYDLTERLRFSVAWGSAFKAPTFNDLYYQSPWGSNGNPDLEPETSESWEIGISGSWEWADWDVRVFRTDAENLIQWVEQAPFVWQPENVSAARIDGIELTASAELLGWELDGALTFVDPEDRKTGNTLPRRSRRTARIDLYRRFADTEFGMSWIAQDHRFDDPDNLVRLSGYGIMDLRFRWFPGDEWEIGLKVGNLFDKAYETAAGYRMPGREVFASLSYHPD